MHGRGHAWQGACMVGGMHGGGMCMAGGCVWWGACMAGGLCSEGRAWKILRDTVNEWAVRILLECILVFSTFWRALVLFCGVRDVLEIW